MATVVDLQVAGSWGEARVKTVYPTSRKLSGGGRAAYAGVTLMFRQMSAVQTDVSAVSQQKDGIMNVTGLAGWDRTLNTTANLPIPSL